MKALKELNGISDLTLYWARHTFGTLARNECCMSVDDIAEALNHIDSGHFTTNMYLAKDWSIVDDVQSQVIKLIVDFSDETQALLTLDPSVSRNSMRIVSV